MSSRTISRTKLEGAVSAGVAAASGLGFDACMVEVGFSTAQSSILVGISQQRQFCSRRLSPKTLTLSRWHRPQIRGKPRGSYLTYVIFPFPCPTLQYGPRAPSQTMLAQAPARPLTGRVR